MEIVKSKNRLKRTTQTLENIAQKYDHEIAGCSLNLNSGAVCMFYRYVRSSDTENIWNAWFDFSGAVGAKSE